MFADGKTLDIRSITSKEYSKKNETSCYEQAVFEAKSLVSKKLDDNYAYSIDKIPNDSDGMFLPMLAHSYDKHSKKIKFPCWIQPKLDGVRMLSKVFAKKENGEVSIWSRKGKEMTTMSKIKEELASVLDEGQSLDGEIYVHGWDFQRIVSAVKKETKDTDLLSIMFMTLLM